jgi:choline dehydrogenase
LLRSGIGPREWLQHLRLDCVREAPQLGLNLQDHLVFPIVYESLLPMTPNGGAIHGRLRREDRMQYLQHRTGPLASNLAELGAFVDCRQSTSLAMQTSGFPASISANFQWHITPTHYLDYPHGKSEAGCISIGITHMRPHSRGRMVPDLGHPNDHPASLAWHIDPGYLQASEEIDAWIQAIACTRNCFEDATWRGVMGREILPGSKRTHADALEVAIRRLATTLYHYSCTCSMGTADDATLDPTMRVRGVDRLWVCDASSMPVMPNCNPQASIMMMAHRLALALLDESR